MTKRKKIRDVLSIAIVAMGLLGFTAGFVGSAQAATVTYNDSTGSYTGYAANSPFYSTFGSITEQDVVVETGFAVTVSTYDYRGLTETVASGATYFFLQDFEDGQLDAPGLSSTVNSVRTKDGRNGSEAKSSASGVSEDGTNNGGLRQAGALMTWTFNSAVLGGNLPTYFGFAYPETWNGVADFADLVTAYDINDNVIGTIDNTAGVTPSTNPFYGFQTDVGISYVTVDMNSAGELDHIQYGYVGAGDTTPPVLTALAPTNTATDVFVNADLIVSFDEGVQKGTGNIVIKKLVGDAVVETIDVTSTNVTTSGTDVTINPTNNLDFSTGYYVEIDSGAIENLANLDYAGFSGSGTWSFTTTELDFTAPVISTLSPANGATDVAIALSSLVATFTEDVKKGTGNVVIKKVSGGAVVETIDVTSGSVTISGAEVTIAVDSFFEPGTGYYVEIDNGAIEDLFGNDFTGISGSSTWSFTTASSIYLPTNTYHAYDNAAQGAGTVSPFAALFGAISQQDVDGGTGETVSGVDLTSTNYYDFRGLGASVVAGETYFFLEDVQDGQIDAPGLTVNGLTARTENGRSGSQSSGNNCDSVDEDDGAVDGGYSNPRGGFRITSGEIRFTFDEGVLGKLPTHAGIVFAERVNTTFTLSAYDSNNVLLETVSINVSYADPFVGIFAESGISYVIVTGEAEFDHFQYGHFVPEPSGTVFYLK